MNPSKENAEIVLEHLACLRAELAAKGVKPSRVLLIEGFVRAVIPRLAHESTITRHKERRLVSQRAKRRYEGRSPAVGA